MFHRQDNSCSRILDPSDPGENCLGTSGILHEMRGTVEAIRLSQCTLAAIPMRYVKRVAYVAIYVRCLRFAHHLLQPRHVFIGTNAAHMVPMESGETGDAGEKIHHASAMHVLHSSENILHLRYYAVRACGAEPLEILSLTDASDLTLRRRRFSRHV